MISGVAGFLPEDPRAIERGHAERLRELGFQGVSVTLPDPGSIEQRHLTRARQILADSGVTVAQANPRYRSLVGPAEVRREGIAAIRAACRCARWLDAANVYIRPGSLNPAGPWRPHEGNTRPETLAQLVASLREAASIAEAEGVVLALEGHVISPLDSPRRVREVIDAVDSPALGFNSDPVNFVGTLADAFDSNALLDRLFAELGDRTVCAHLKDFRLEDRLVFHIAECTPGDGALDLAEFLRRFALACPTGCVLIEHLPKDRVPAAKAAVDAAAKAAGLSFG